MQDSDSVTSSAHAAARDERPARAGERNLWLLDRMAPDRAVGNITLAVRSAAPLDVERLRQAVGRVVRRHPALRSRFALVDGALMRRILTLDDPPFDVFHVSQEDEAESLRRFAERPFNLAADQPSTTVGEHASEPLLRAALVITPVGETLCLVCHHTVFDGTSALILTRELVRAYSALSTADGQLPPELLEEVADFTAPAPRASSLDFWRDQLADVDVRSMDLRCDRTRPAEPTFRGQQRIHPLSADTHHLLAASEATLQATRNIVLLAVYLLVLARHGAGPDITVGVPIDVRGGRGRGSVGYHTHTVVLRIDIQRPQSFRELVAVTRDTFLAALGHADASIDDVIDRYGIHGGSAENRHFHHMFNYFDFHTSVDEASWTPGGADVEVVEVAPRHSIADLELVVRTRSDRTELVVVYGTDVLGQDEALALVGRYDVLLHAALRSPNSPLHALDWYTPHDRQTFNPPMAPATAWRGGLLAAITAQARETPNATAVIGTDRATSYTALLDGAAQIRGLLEDAGVGPGAIVALDAARAAATVAGALAVWSLGAAYLPVDHTHPAPLTARRLAGMRLGAVLGRPLDEATPPAVPVIPFPALRTAGPWRDLPDTSPVDPDTLAFVIHTSGSTGRPKAVPLTHSNVHHAVTAFAADLGLGAGASALWLTTFAFEPSSLEVFAPLLLGGHVIAVPDAARQDSARLAALLAQHPVDLIQATPTVWRVLAPGLKGLCDGITLVTGGEPLNGATAQHLLSTEGRVLNAYGATETAGWPVLGEVTHVSTTHRPLPVGRPTAGHRVDILDDAGRPLPPGLRGEISITGPAVTTGYLNADVRYTIDATGHRTHRTGDIGRLQPDGTLEVTGRADRQIKLLGLRIEPAEVEAVLEDHPSVGRCGIIVTRDSEHPTLVAFVEPATVDPALLRAHAARHLPAPAIPSRIIPLSTLPRTDTGKIAHAKLHAEPHTPRPESTHTRAQTGELPEGDGTASTLTERLTTAWRGVLEDDRADATTDFFAAGGNSLLAVLLSERVEECTGHQVSLGTLLTRATPAALATHLAGKSGPPAPSPAGS